MNSLKAIWLDQIAKNKLDPRDKTIPWPHLKLAEEIKRIDANNDGKIDFDEFEALFFPPPEKKSKKSDSIDYLCPSSYDGIGKMARLN